MDTFNKILVTMFVICVLIIFAASVMNGYGEHKCADTCFPYQVAKCEASMAICSTDIAGTFVSRPVKW